MRGFCCVLVLDTLPERVLFMPAVGFALFCHSLARVSSLLLGNALFTRCGSALLSFITSFWINTHHGILDLKLLCLVVDNPLSSTDRLASCHFLRHHPIWPCLPKLLASVGAVFAPRRRCASARSSTCCATSPRAPHTLCLQSSSALGRHSFQSNYNTACLLVCSPYLMKQRVGLLNCFVFCSFSSTLW